MLKNRIATRLLFGYLCVMVLPLVVATWYTSSLYKKSYINQVIASEKKNAWLLGGDIAPLLATGEYGNVDSLCKKYSREIGMRITVILPTGKVIGDSDRDPDSLENHRYRPEIMQALSASRDIPAVGSSSRFSATLQKKMLYVAVPLFDKQDIIAVVRTSVPLDPIINTLWGFYKRILLIAIAMGLLASLLSYILTRRIVVPIHDLQSGAERFASGELSAKIGLPDIEELRHLAGALNEMAAQLNGRIRTITAQRNEQEAILAGMSEGVIAIDGSGHILSVNKAAVDLFLLEKSNIKGRLLGEVIRNSRFLLFADKVLSSDQSSEGDIPLPVTIGGKETERILQIHGSVLRDSDKNSAGAVLVVSDVTRLRRLETMRKEFVANVSHELRTPLTTIKGFIETLQTGALESKEEAARFLGIMAAQAERLTTLVEDLLTLAVIEREEETAAPVLELRSVYEIANAAVREHLVHAKAKGISLSISGDHTIRGRINAPLLQQAVGNLIDNAIKYSENGHPVEACVIKQDNEIIIAVADHGIGIASEHLDRLFERFYRVDKARSRKAGGTGLGLAIVKHIAGLHGGRCAVESEPGKGSTFRIILPLANGENGKNPKL